MKTTFKVIRSFGHESHALGCERGHAPEPKEGPEKSPFEIQYDRRLGSSNGAPDNGLDYRSNLQPFTLSDLRSKEE